MNEEALAVLSKIAMETSLRYAIQLIIASDLVREKDDKDKVEISHVSKVYRLLLDEKRSTSFLQEYQDQYMFNKTI